MKNSSAFFTASFGIFWAHRVELPEPDSFKTTWLGETPILITRGADDRIRAFINACSHRGTMLEQRSSGCAKSFRCPYHSWMFDNKGMFCSAPRQDNFRSDFEAKDYGLPELKVENSPVLCFVLWLPRSRLRSGLGIAGRMFETA